MRGWARKRDLRGAARLVLVHGVSLEVVDQPVRRREHLLSEPVPERHGPHLLQDFGVWGLGFGGWDSGFGGLDLGSGVQGLGYGI